MQSILFLETSSNYVSKRLAEYQSSNMMWYHQVYERGQNKKLSHFFFLKQITKLANDQKDGPFFLYRCTSIMKQK